MVAISGLSCLQNVSTNCPSPPSPLGQSECLLEKEKAKTQELI